MNNKEVQEVIDFIYENGLENNFMQYTPWHWKLLRKINIWPNSKRYYIDGGEGSKTYKNINELKDLVKKYAKKFNEGRVI